MSIALNLDHSTAIRPAVASRPSLIGLSKAQLAAAGQPDQQARAAEELRPDDQRNGQQVGEHPADQEQERPRQGHHSEDRDHDQHHDAAQHPQDAAGERATPDDSDTIQAIGNSA